MTSMQSHIRSLLAITAVALGLGACADLDERTHAALATFTPYTVEVVQGNFISKEQVEQLKVGMARQDVRDTLGTPLLNDVFHGDRWDYVFTIRRQGIAPQQRGLTVFFDGDRLARFAGDDMPSEQAFVAALDSRRRIGKVPRLEATQEELRKFGSASPAPSEVTQAPSTPLPASYPPLESKGEGGS